MIDFMQHADYCKRTGYKISGINKTTELKFELKGIETDSNEPGFAESYERIMDSLKTGRSDDLQPIFERASDKVSELTSTKEVSVSINNQLTH